MQGSDDRNSGDWHTVNTRRDKRKTRAKRETKTLIIRGGVVLEPINRLKGEFRVYRKGDCRYTAVLCRCDNNSYTYYCKIRILQSIDEPNKYYVYRWWGQIGSEVVEEDYEMKRNRKEAINDFKDWFKYLTDIEWEHRFKWKLWEHNPRINDTGKSRINDTGKYSFVDTDCREAMLKILQELLVIPGPKPDDDPGHAFGDSVIRRIYKTDNLIDVMDFVVTIDVACNPIGIQSTANLNQGSYILKKILNELHKGIKRDMSKITLWTQQYYQTIPRKSSYQNQLLELNEMHRVDNEMDKLKHIRDITYTLTPCDSILGGLTLIAYLRHTLGVTFCEANPHEYSLITRYVALSDGRVYKDGIKGYSLQVNRVIRIQPNNWTQESSASMRYRLYFHGTHDANIPDIIQNGFHQEINYFGDLANKSMHYTDSNGSTVRLLACGVRVDGLKSFNSELEFNTYLQNNGNKLSHDAIAVRLDGRRGTVGTAGIVGGNVEVPKCIKVFNGDCYRVKKEYLKDLEYNEILVENPDYCSPLYILECTYINKLNINGSHESASPG